MTPHQHLSGDLATIFNHTIREDLAAFLARALSDDPDSHLSYDLKKRRKKDRNKSETVKSWKSLDLGELLEVTEDRYELLKIGAKSREAKKCIQRMRELRNELAHPTGDVDFHGLYNDAILLERFAKFIEASPATRGDIQDLIEKMKAELERTAGIKSQPVTAADRESSPNYFQSCGNPFEKFEQLLAIHKGFVGQSRNIARIHDFVSAHKSGLLILEAELGAGKSALIARCIEKEFAHAVPSPAYYLYSRIHRLTQPDDCLRTLYEQLVQIHEIEQAEPLQTTDTSRTLLAKLERLLKNHVAPQLGQDKQLIVIDALDEASTDGELTAYLSLPWGLPEGLIVIASTRVNPALEEALSQRDDIDRLELNPADRRSETYEDATLFVEDRLDGKSVDKATQVEIRSAGAGNFVVLEELCNWASETRRPEEVAEFSRRLAKESDRLRAIYDERCWRRLPPEELGTIGEVAALILECRTQTTAGIAVEVLDNGLAKWKVATDCLAEYLQPWPEADGSISYGFKSHPLAEYLRTKVGQSYTKRVKERLAKMCLRWRDRELSNEIRDYAIEHGPTHLCRAERWEDLRSSLTDLEFIEEKCRIGKVSDLVADYDLARRNDPDWLTAIKNERRRQHALQNWAADVTASGWADEVRRAWQQEEPELVELARPFLAFPDPPDASDLCNLLLSKRAEELWDASSWPVSVRNLESLRTFLTHFSATLARHPKAFVPCAANSSMEPEIRAQAVKLLSERKIRWLEETPRMALDAGIIPLPEIHVSATAFAISADGRRAATGEANGTVRLWDLINGNCLHWQRTHPEQVSHVSLSVDGGRLVSTSKISTSKSGLIQVHDCRDFREIWSAEIESDVVDLSFSPEGSIVVVACHDGKVRVLDVEVRSGKCRYELSDSGLEPFARVAIFPEQFCVLAFGNGRSAFWDIVTGRALDRLPSGTRDMRHVLKADASSEDKTPTLIGIGQFVCFNVEGRSADGRIALERDGIDVEGEWREGFDDVGLPAVWYSHANNRQLTADGRVVWGRGEDGIRGMDLMACEWPEEFEERRPLLDRSRSQLETYRYHFANLDDFVDDFSFLDDDDFSGPEETDGLQATDQPVMKGIRLFTRITEEPPSDPAQAFMFDISSYKQAYSPDFRILIDFDSVAEDEREWLYSINRNVPEDEDVSLIQISPTGQYAFVSLTCNWFVWDLATGRRMPAREQNSAKLSAVFPDWKCVALIENGKLVIVDLLNGVELVQEKLDTSSIGIPCAIQITADGRRIVIVGSAGISVWSISKSKLSRELNVPGASAPIISPDAEFMVCFVNQTVEVYLLATKEKLLSQPCRNVPSIFASPWDYAWIATDGKIIRTHHESHQLQLTLRNSPEIGECLETIVTPTRVFNYDSDAAKLRHAAENGAPLPGQDAPHRTAVCLHCGKRLKVPDSAEIVLDDIIHSANLSPDKSLCLHLPDEAWNTPELRIRCEHCELPLRLNPFVAW